MNSFDWIEGYKIDVADEQSEGVLPLRVEEGLCLQWVISERFPRTFFPAWNSV